MMKDMKQLRRLLVLVMVLAIAGCKSLKDPSESTFESIPQQFYSEQTDSLNSGMLTPKELFNDPLLTQLIDSVLVHNLSLLRSETTLMQLEADVLEARTNLIPKAGTYVGYSNRKFGLQTMDGAGNITTPIGD